MGIRSNRRAFTPRKFSWAYPLLVTAIVLPVVCVIWLLQKAIEGEREVVQKFILEAQERTLVDAKSELTERFKERIETFHKTHFYDDRIELAAAMRAIRGSGTADSFSYSGEENHQSKYRNTDAARALLGRFRSILNSEEDSRVSLLEEVLFDAELTKTQFADGRNAWLIGLLLALNFYEGKDEIPGPLVVSLNDVFAGKIASNSPLKQLEYLKRRFGVYVTSDEAVSVVEAISLSERWRRFNQNQSVLDSWRIENGIIGIGDSSLGLTLLFETESFLELASLDLAGIDVIEVSEQGRASYALVRPLPAPLSSFTLALKQGVSGLSSTEGASRIGLYFWIGGIVLALSMCSGLAIIVLMRRQSGAAQLKNDLVATVTHELKTPVASIRLLVDTLRDSNKSDKVNTEEYLSLIDKENRRLGGLIDDFLSFSRMERNKSNFLLEPLAANLVVEASEEAFRERFVGSRFSFEVKVDEAVPEILGDKDALVTALGNLLENALKYGGPFPLIELNLVASDEGACISVRDHGNGIPKREQHKVFRRFYQGRRKLSSHAGGVGLGLSIVSFILSEHKGQVSLESEEGKGCEFTLVIPYA